MKKRAPRPLLHQLLLVILAVMAVVLVIQGVFLLHIRRQEARTARNYIESIVTSVERAIATNLVNIERAGFALSYNSDLMRLYAQQKDPQASITSVLEVIKLIYYDNQGDVLDVSLIGLDGSRRSLLMGISSQMNDTQMGLYDFQDINATDRQFIFFDPQSPYRNTYYIYLAPLFDLTSPGGSQNRKLATIVFTAELTSLKRAVNVVDPANAILWVTDTGNNIILSNQPSFGPQDFERTALRAPITTQQQIFGTGLTITAALVEQNSIAGQQIIQYMLIVMLVFVITLLVTLLFFRNQISAPMNQLRDDIEVVGRGGLSTRVHLYNSQEINHIAAWINSMLAQLETASQQSAQARQKIYEIEILKNQAELYSLRNQINPHFLYNTLQAMRGIAIENDMPHLADMASALFEIFSYSIKGRNRTTIQQELFIAQQYLHIFEFRYQGNFEYSIQAADDVLELAILKMTFQPIIENSIQHGFSNHQGVMRIEIGVARKGDSVRITIADNGTGIPLEKLAQLRALLADDTSDTLPRDQFRSYGLGNINRRLKLIFGESYNLEIENLPRGTRVTLYIPALPFPPDP